MADDFQPRKERMASTSTAAGAVTRRLAALVASGSLRADATQASAAAVLDEVRFALVMLLLLLLLLLLLMMMMMMSAE